MPSFYSVLEVDKTTFFSVLSPFKKQYKKEEGKLVAMFFVILTFFGVVL